MVCNGWSIQNFNDLLKNWSSRREAEKFYRYFTIVVRRELSVRVGEKVDQSLVYATGGLLWPILASWSASWGPERSGKLPNKSPNTENAKIRKYVILNIKMSQNIFCSSIRIPFSLLSASFLEVFHVTGRSRILKYADLPRTFFFVSLVTCK